MRAFLNKKILFAGIGSLVIGAALTAGVFAAIPDSNTGRITACRNNNTGTLKAIDAQNGATCGNFETMLSWYSTSAPSAGSAPKTAVFHLSPNPDSTDTDYPQIYNPAYSRGIVSVKKLVTNDPVNNPYDGRGYCTDLNFTVLYDSVTGGHNGPGVVSTPASVEGANDVDLICGPGYDAFIPVGYELRQIFFSE